MRYQVRENTAVKCACHRFGIWDSVMNRWYDSAYGTEEEAVEYADSLNAGAAAYGGY